MKNNGIGKEYLHQQIKGGEAARSALDADVPEMGMVKRDSFFVLEGAIGNIVTETGNISHFIRGLYGQLSNLIDNSRSGTSPDSSYTSSLDRLACFMYEVKGMMPIIDILTDYSENCAKEANELWDTINDIVKAMHDSVTPEPPLARPAAPKIDAY
jgi:hypothetical protein